MNSLPFTVSVMPKYGRMVMFRNYIPHSARPPSPSFHGSRYTFAVKVSDFEIRRTFSCWNGSTCDVK